MCESPENPRVIICCKKTINIHGEEQLGKTIATCLEQSTDDVLTFLTRHTPHHEDWLEVQSLEQWNKEQFSTTPDPLADTRMRKLIDEGGGLYIYGHPEITRS